MFEKKARGATNTDPLFVVMMAELSNIGKIRRYEKNLPDTHTEFIIYYVMLFILFYDLFTILCYCF